MKNENKLTGRDGLKVGDVVWFKNVKVDDAPIEYVVWYKNESRAAIAPLTSQIEHRIFDDGKVRFMAQGETLDISPNSELEILRRLGRNGLRQYLLNRPKQTKTNKQQKDNNSMAKNTKSSGKDKTEVKERAGKLGGYKGHSITSVIRAFGKAGWNLDEARAFFEKKEIAVADTTIKIQLRQGRIGEGGDPAGFTKDELAAMKPKVKAKAAKDEDTKPAKSKKDGKKSKPAKDEDTEEAEEPSEEEQVEV